MGSFRVACLVALALASSPLGAQGVLVVETSPREALVDVDSVRLGRGGVVATLPMGRHDVHVSHVGYRSVTESVVVADGDTTRIRVALDRLVGAVELAALPEGARIFVDGERVPGAVFEADVGDHRVRVERDGWRDVSGTVFVMPDTTVRVHYRTDIPAPRVVAYSLFAPPGVVQLVDKRPLAGAAFVAAELGALGTAFLGHQRAREADRERAEALERYAAARSEQAAVDARTEAEEATERGRSARWQRGIALGLGGAIHLASFVDAFLNHSRRAGLVAPDPIRLRVRIDGDRPRVIATIPLP